MRWARMVIFASPGAIFFQKTCSTLLSRSKSLDVPILPCRSWPSAAITIRSRSFCRSAPAGSVQTHPGSASRRLLETTVRGHGAGQVGASGRGAGQDGEGIENEMLAGGSDPVGQDVA